MDKLLEVNPRTRAHPSQPVARAPKCVSVSCLGSTVKFWSLVCSAMHALPASARIGLVR